MTAIEYPGVLLRAVPPFSCARPSAWTAEEVPGAIVAMRPPADPGGEPATHPPTRPRTEPATELRIEAVRIAAATSIRDLAAADLARRRRSHPDLAVVTSKAGRFGDTPAHLTGCAWTDEDGHRVAVLHVVVAAPSEPGRPVLDTFVFTGTCPEERAREIVPEFVRIAASIRFATTAEPAAAITVGAHADPFTTAS